jgi:acyl-CoA synthetase (AMP-forming)/AMP-acid ligase II
VEIKVTDPETGRVVPRGTPGELCTRGYSVMPGYWDEPVTGKIQKFKMRETSVTELDLAEASDVRTA